MLHAGVDHSKEQYSDKGNQAYSPIENHQHQHNEGRIEKPLCCLHDHTGRHIAEQLHRVGGHRADIAEAFSVKKAHGQKAQLFRDFDALVCALPIARPALQHGLLSAKCGLCEYPAEQEQKADAHGAARQAMSQKAVEHEAHSRIFDHLASGNQHTEQQGLIKHAPMFRRTKGKELFECRNHSDSPPSSEQSLALLCASHIFR